MVQSEDDDKPKRKFFLSGQLTPDPAPAAPASSIFNLASLASLPGLPGLPGLGGPGALSGGGLPGLSGGLGCNSIEKNVA